MAEIRRSLNTKFAETSEPEKTTQYFSPGRINLIGEHADYNGGHAFPASITYGTQGVAALRDDNEILAYPTNFDDIGATSFTLNELEYDKKVNWASYIKGMILKLKEAGHLIDHGFELIAKGTVPDGAEFPSSTSLELLVGAVLEDLFDLKTDRLELIQTGEKVESEFISVNLDTMDQFTIGFGRLDHATSLDTNTLKYEIVSVKLDGYATVIMNTNRRRELADSEYNERHDECEEALVRLRRALPVFSLGDLDKEEFESTIDQAGDDTLIRRARHAVSESQRTLKARAELEAGNLEVFGRPLNDSHHSLRYDHEATETGLDTLVDAARKQEGILGVRMTGAGLGGCVITLVREKSILTFRNNVYDEYIRVVDHVPEFYAAHIGNGTTEIDPEAARVR